MGKNPAFQYYPSDFDRDTSTVSLAATGAWIRIMNAMWYTPNRGEITCSVDRYGILIRSTTEAAIAVLNELIEAKVCDAFFDEERQRPVTKTLHVTDCNEKVTLVCRRMDREEKARKSTALRVAKFRNARSNTDVTTPSSVLHSSVLHSSKENTETSRAGAREPSPKHELELEDKIPEIELYHEITGQDPSIVNQERIEAALHGKTKEQVVPFFQAWDACGYNPRGLGWLPWVESGEIPERVKGNGKRAGPRDKEWKSLKVIQELEERDRRKAHGHSE